MRQLLSDGRPMIANGEMVQIGGEVIALDDLPAVEKFIKDARKFKGATNADNTSADEGDQK